MHLLRVRLVRCACFHTFSHIGPRTYKDRPWSLQGIPRAVVDWLEGPPNVGPPPIVADSSPGGRSATLLMANASDEIRHQAPSSAITRHQASANASDEIRHIRHIFNDLSPPNMYTPRLLCQHPIVIHKVLPSSAYLGLWRALDIRDVASDQLLWGWRRQHEDGQPRVRQEARQPPRKAQAPARASPGPAIQSAACQPSAEPSARAHPKWLRLAVRLLARGRASTERIAQAVRALAAEQGCPIDERMLDTLYDDVHALPLGRVGSLVSALTGPRP